MRHWLSMLDWEPRELADLVALARLAKAGDASIGAPLKGRVVVMVFFNPSLRTRASCEAAMLRHGGHAICLDVGGNTWKLECRDGVVMDGEAAEHIREAAPVLSRYGDLLAVRTFAELKDAATDAEDRVLRAFGRHATVPVVNLESAVEHPCQGLADWMTWEEKLGGVGRHGGRPLRGTRGRRFTVTWAPQAKGVPMAVPHSAVLSAAAAGMHVTIAHPPGYELNAGILDRARVWCGAAGTELRITHDQAEACRTADALYVKSWASPALYGRPDAQQASFARHKGWMVDVGELGPQTILMHCLPVRRNVVISDAALNDPRCVVVDQAENRLWTKVAIFGRLLGRKAVN